MSDKPAEPKKFEDLTGDVDWQLKSLLSYIEKGFKVSTRNRKNMSPSEIVVQNVVDAYLCLADSFYKQFKDQLKVAYEQSMSSTPPQDLISEADVSILVQKALDKLTAEWARAYGFMAATEAKRTSETEKIITQLSPLIRAAVRDVGFSPDSLPVIPQFGMTYSLGFFNYTDDFMALNLPITALQSPWEWTIFWHEIAGQRVRLLKKIHVEFQNALKEMFSEYKRQSQQYSFSSDELRISMNIGLLYVIHLIVPFSQMKTIPFEQESGFLHMLTDCVFDDFMNNQDPSLTKTRKFIQDVPRLGGLPLLMFSFDDLLYEITEELRLQSKTSVKKRLRAAHTEALAIEELRKDPKKEQVMDELLAAWDDALSLEQTLAAQKKSLDDEGWSADWLEELFEDSFSVMNFDIKFLSVFDRLLHRHADGGRDLRHPPHHVRLAMAAALKLLDCDETLQHDDLPPKTERFSTGLSDEEIETLKKFYPGTLSTDSLSIVWLAAKRFHNMQKGIKTPDDGSDEVIQKAKQAITNAMKTHIRNENTSESIAKSANKVLTSLAGTISNLAKVFQGEAQATVSTQYQNKIETLLKSRNITPPQVPLGFRELLDLTFHDVDNLGTTISNVVVDGKARSWTINWMGKLTTEVKEGRLEGPVTYLVDNNRRGTTVPNWNRVFDGTIYEL